MPNIKIFLINIFCATSLAALPIRLADIGSAQPNETFTIASIPLAKHIRLESLDGFHAPSTLDSGGSGVGVNGQWFLPSDDAGPAASHWNVPATGGLDESGWTNSRSAAGGRGAGATRLSGRSTVLQSALALEDSTLDLVRSRVSGAGTGQNGRSDEPAKSGSGATNAALTTSSPTPLTTASSSAMTSGELEDLATLTTAAVAPEPSPFLLAGFGLVAFALVRRGR